MAKYIYSIAILGMLFFGNATCGATSLNVSDISEMTDNGFQGVTISVNESVLHVSGANGMVLYIYNVAGVCVMNRRIDGSDKRYDLNLPKGCYIIKVGKTVRKISIK